MIFKYKIGKVDIITRFFLSKPETRGVYSAWLTMLTGKEGRFKICGWGGKKIKIKRTEKKMKRICKRGDNKNKKEF